MMNQEQTTNKADALARDVLTLARNTLLVNLRFLDAALSRFSPLSRAGCALATDGQALYYDAIHVLRSYRAEHAAPVRDYLHLVLHCLFRHMYPHKRVEPDIWDLACDIAVEHAISELGLTAVAVEREQKQRRLAAALREQAGMLTAEKIYRHLMEKPLPPADMEELRAVFPADDHRLWHTDGGPPEEDTEELWKDVSRRMQVDIETFARKQGDRAQALMQNLREVNRVKYDYAGFLQRFAARGEAMKTDPEEFDYIFYTYGLQRYDNMPLIEPLEYKPVRRVRDFVLAVGLTGLVSVEQAQRFVRRTYEVLKATESFSTKIELHILTQNPSSVEYTKITDGEKLEEYLNGLKLYRREETDFRPVFQKVDELTHERAFCNLKGLLYLTDGVGAFPPNKPGYEAVFVFVNDNYSSPDVPPWAIRLVLQKDELE